MKKLLPIAAMALLATAFTSCKKDYTCECTTTEPGTTAITTKFTLNDQKKKDADAACNAKSTSYTVGSITTTITCKLD